jgi:hemerythrin-like metal-binding protein
VTPLPPEDPRLVTFDQRLHIGVPAIDDEHGSLIGALNRLLADDGAGPASELFTSVLTQLGRELDDHFRHEERHFALLGLPEPMAAAHIAAHGEILSQYAQLNLDLMRPHRHARSGLLVLLRGWIVDHIVSFDLGLRRYVAP